VYSVKDPCQVDLAGSQVDLAEPYFKLDLNIELLKQGSASRGGGGIVMVRSSPNFDVFNAADASRTYF
jgi:hypothetical protein